MSNKKLFYMTSPGACLSQILITLKDGVINSCTMSGTCPGNLKVISDNLVGEKIENACKCIDICPKNNDCTRELEQVLANIFSEIAESEK